MRGQSRFRETIGRTCNLVLLSVLAALLVSPPNTQQIHAMNSKQRDLYESGVYAYDISSNICTLGGGITLIGQSDFLTGNPITLRFPAITDDAKFATVMENFIRNSYPDSPWLAIPNLGTRLVEEGKKQDVNPMMVLVIGRHETHFGTTPGGSASVNNSFGYKGPNPPGEPESDYKKFPSFEDSLFGSANFIARVAYNLSGKHPSYKDVTNMYEYLSVHVSGQIIYPGDSTTSYDTTMKVQIDQDGESGYAGPKQYFENAAAWIGEMTNITIEGTPKRSGDTATCGGLGGSGIVNAEGYSFPLEDQTKRPYWGLPCRVAGGCHHTGGVSGLNKAAAFDLAYGSNNAEMGGKDVYAISDGVIVNRKVYRGVAGCYSIQFYSTKDNLYYWYGHLQNPNMSLKVVDPPSKATEADIVKAGTPIAEVAGHQLGPVCHGRSASSEVASHLHIDRGCPGYRGGGGTCRDLSFIDFMNNLWMSLPPPPEGN